MKKSIEEQRENAPNSSNEKHNVNGHGKLQVHENLKSNAKDKVKSLKKTVFLDRDGTINEEVSYLHKVEDFRFLPHVLEGLSTLSKAGFQLVVVTNQAGIGRGYYGEKDAEALHLFLREELKKRDIFLKGIYYCPHHPKGIGAYQRECDCRKPNPGMLYQAEWDLLQENEAETPIQSPYCLSREEREALEQEHRQAERKAWLSHSYMIGDKILDCEAGENFGVQPILLASGYGKEEKRKLEEEGKPCPPYFENLEEAARWIVERELYSLHSVL